MCDLCVALQAYLECQLALKCRQKREGLKSVVRTHRFHIHTTRSIVPHELSERGRRRRPADATHRTPRARRDNLSMTFFCAISQRNKRECSRPGSGTSARVKGTSSSRKIIGGVADSCVCKETKWSFSLKVSTVISPSCSLSKAKL